MVQVDSLYEYEFLHPWILQYGLLDAKNASSSNSKISGPDSYPFIFSLTVLRATPVVIHISFECGLFCLEF